MKKKMSLQNLINNHILKPLADKTTPPRFFTKKEWSKMNDKEKLWITEEDWWMRKGIGDSHLSKIEGVVIQIIAIMTGLKIWGIPDWLIIFAPPILLVSWLVKVKVADYLDEKDLIALGTEPSNRRNKVFREIRKNGGKK